MSVIAVELTIVGLWYLSIFLHEAGHALAAHCRGFRVISVFIGPLVMSGLRLRFRPVFLGGAVLAVPRTWDGEARFRRDFFWFIAGGPAASLATGAIGLSATHWLVGSALAIPVWIASMIALAFGTLTLIPTRSPWATSDGHKLLTLWRSRTNAINALRMMMNSKRPRDWDAALVDVARRESEVEGSDAIDATMLLYYRALDNRDVASAHTLLQRLIDYTCGTARWPRPTIACEVGVEAALFEAAWRGDAAAAAEWMARAPFPPRGSEKRRRLLVDLTAGKPAAIARVRRQSEHTGFPAGRLLMETTLERLSSSGSD